MDTLLQELTNESRWIAPALLVAVLAASSLSRTLRDAPRTRVQVAMDALAGTLIGVLAFGHILAVTVESAQGTLDGAPTLLYGIGFALAVPSALLVAHARVARRDRVMSGRRSALLNALLVGALLVTGPRNLPLAVPSILATLHAVHRRRVVGRILLTLLALFTLLLFAGSVRFFLSGGSFEEFSGM